MPIEKIAQILKDHSVPYYIENEHIFADSMRGGTALFEEVIDLTGYSVRRLRDWLGY